MRLAPTALLGVAGSGVAAIAGHQHWHKVSGDGTLGNASGLDRPEVTGVALVMLTAWGVLLVTRGVVRRAVAVLAVLAGLATIGLAVEGLRGVSMRDIAWYSTSASGPSLSLTAWPWIAIVAAVVATAASVGAVVWAPAWPEMGRKYDAPTQPAAPVAVPLEEQSALDVWKAMDEGHDPTSDGSSAPPE